MTSQAQLQQRAWKAYCEKLAKAGLAPTNEQSLAFQRIHQFANTVDPEVGNGVLEILAQYSK